MKKKNRGILEDNNIIDALAELYHEAGNLPIGALFELEADEECDDYCVKVICYVSKESYDKIRKLMKKQRKEHTGKESQITTACVTGNAED